MRKEIYNGYYQYKEQKRKIELINDFQSLSVCIDDMFFIGEEFSNLEIIGKEGIDNNLITLDSFNCLCDCSFHFNIPLIVINKKGVDHLVTLCIVYELGKELPNCALDKEFMHLQVEINGALYFVNGSWFEEAFEILEGQFSGEYYLKNCFGCMFGDYSVYGNSSFGTLYCFRNAKTEYLDCKSKEDYIKLWDSRQPIRMQEIDLCDQFEVRDNNVGYR